MLQKELIDKFLDSKVIAVIGFSRKKDIPANYIYEKFEKAGYHVYAINPNTSEIDGVKCYPDIKSAPNLPEAVLLASTPEVSEIVVDQCIEQGIKKIWMHRGFGNGSYSKNAEVKCTDNGFEAITNGCPMMFVKPVDTFHRIFRWFK